MARLLRRPINIGRDFFEVHKMYAERVGLDNDHVIIDKEDYEVVMEWLRVHCFQSRVNTSIERALLIEAGIDTTFMGIKG